LQRVLTLSVGKVDIQRGDFLHDVQKALSTLKADCVAVTTPPCVVTLRPMRMTTYAYSVDTGARITHLQGQNLSKHVHKQMFPLQKWKPLSSARCPGCRQQFQTTTVTCKNEKRRSRTHRERPFSADSLTSPALLPHLLGHNRLVRGHEQYRNHRKDSPYQDRHEHRV
jgi:hypothetical protein